MIASQVLPRAGWPGKFRPMNSTYDSLPPPPPSAHETVDAMVADAKRTDVPIRLEFARSTSTESAPGPGPLADFVRSGDGRGLVLWMLALTKASGDDFTVTLAATVWARAMGFALPETKSARTAISKAWMRLERRRLISRERSGRLTRVALLREDGSGRPYEQTPGAARERYLKVPHAFWLQGPVPGRRWYEALALPEIAMLIIARTMGNRFRLPLESVPDWYGISADSALRGLHGLKDHGLLSIEKNYKKAPLAPQGYTAENLYTLKEPFGPMAVDARARRLGRR